ncbi:MAG: hypothetical protein ACP5E4_00255 [Candidatus Aenigmatarchaeota archaeon]
MEAKHFLSVFIILFLISPALAVKETTIYLPAVQETDYGQEGVMATLTVNVRPGSGHVYVDTWPLAKIDTQASARIAKEVSCGILYRDCSNYDFFYTIRSDARIVGGPSGGAAMAVATLASLLDLNINNNVLITGTINPDGSIGSVAGILEKARTSGEKGNTFLIPYGQNEVKTGRASEPIYITEYAAENWNLTVHEVRNIKEAFEHFTNYRIIDLEPEFKRTESYQKIMKVFGKELIAHAEQLQEACLLEAKNSRLDYSRQQEILDMCNSPLDEPNAAFEKEDYYSAASLAFSDSITYKNGIMLARLLTSTDKKSFANDYLKSIEGHERNISTSNIELYSIVEERYSEFAENLEIAWKNYYSADYEKSIYYGSLAEERLYTAVLWNEHSDSFPSYIEATPENLNALSGELISGAYSTLTYTTMISPNSFSAEAEKYIEQAEESRKKGDYYAAIVQALKGEANAEISSEISGSEDLDYNLDLHRKAALVSLDQTNSVIGQSYFEYARTLEKDNPSAALIYYTYSEKLSKLNNILNKKPLWSEIRPTEYLKPVECEYDKLAPLFLSALIICFLLGRLL